MDNIKTPCKGGPITAEWARRITDRANRTATTSPLLSPGIQRPPEGPSDYAFKVSMSDEYFKLWVCLPSGCLVYDGDEVDVAAGRDRAERDDFSRGTSPEKVDVDGRFGHVYRLAFRVGDLTSDVGTYGIHGVVVKGASLRLAFAIGKDGDIGFGSCAESGERVAATFRIANVKVESADPEISDNPYVRIEQVARGAVHLRGESRGELVQVISGDSASGYTVKVSRPDGTWEEDSRRLYLPEVSLGYALKPGTRIMARAVEVQAVGGTKEAE